MQSVIRPSNTTDSITIEALSYSYRGLQVFKDFSLQANSKTVVLRGASGCGKTTLLKLLSGNLHPDSARAMPSSAGSCLVLQEDSLFPWLTGIENISKLTRLAPSQFQFHPMYELLKTFVGRKACRMSYGQRRMVELFRAIVFRPRYLYLDEPFNFLDEGNMGLIVPFLQDEYLKETTLVLSNHHKDDGGMIKSASIFKFDGEFPVTSLERVN
jgi:NitT/TauT family transport system ATP-binding protein